MAWGGGGLGDQEREKKSPCSVCGVLLSFAIFGFVEENATVVTVARPSSSKSVSSDTQCAVRQRERGCHCCVDRAGSSLRVPKLSALIRNNIRKIQCQSKENGNNKIVRSEWFGAPNVGLGLCERSPIGGGKVRNPLQEQWARGR